MTPFSVNDDPEKSFIAPLPKTKAPPCIHIMTGSFEFFLISAGAHTLRNKQSSEDVFEIESAPPRGNAACGQSAQNLFASRTPCHAFAG